MIFHGRPRASWATPSCRSREVRASARTSPTAKRYSPGLLDRVVPEIAVAQAELGDDLAQCSVAADFVERARDGMVQVHVAQREGITGVSVFVRRHLVTDGEFHRRIRMIRHD